MGPMYTRIQDFPGAAKESFFLWGARQTGKSTLLKAKFPDRLWFDLLLSDEFERLFREIVLADNDKKTVIVDEIQRLPELLNEVHWLMVNSER